MRRGHGGTGHRNCPAHTGLDPLRRGEGTGHMPPEGPPTPGLRAQRAGAGASPSATGSLGENPTRRKANQASGSSRTEHRESQMEQGVLGLRRRRRPPRAHRSPCRLHPEYVPPAAREGRQVGARSSESSGGGREAGSRAARPVLRTFLRLPSSLRIDADAWVT